jgi:hypothetical protein
MNDDTFLKEDETTESKTADPFEVANVVVKIKFLAGQLGKRQVILAVAQEGGEGIIEMLPETALVLPPVVVEKIEQVIARVTVNSKPVTTDMQISPVQTNTLAKTAKALKTKSVDQLSLFDV